MTADSKLWEQAERVVKLLDGGMTQQQVADKWENVREGGYYSRQHVALVFAVFSRYRDSKERPRFRAAYEEAENRKSAHVSRATGQNEWYTPAAEIKIRAERRAGEMLGEMAASGERTTRQTAKDRSSSRARLDSLDVTKSQSSRWQAEATIPEPQPGRGIGRPPRRSRILGQRRAKFSSRGGLLAVFGG